MNKLKCNYSIINISVIVIAILVSLALLNYFNSKTRKTIESLDNNIIESPAVFCTADYGTDSSLAKTHQICPETKPICNQYVSGKFQGTCGYNKSPNKMIDFVFTEPRPPPHPMPVLSTPMPVLSTPICKAGGINNSFKSNPQAIESCSKIMNEAECKANKFCTLISEAKAEAAKAATAKIVADKAAALAKIIADKAAAAKVAADKAAAAAAKLTSDKAAAAKAAVALAKIIADKAAAAKIASDKAAAAAAKSTSDKAAAAKAATAKAAADKAAADKVAADKVASDKAAAEKAAAAKAAADKAAADKAAADKAAADKAAADKAAAAKAAVAKAVATKAAADKAVADKAAADKAVADKAAADKAVADKAVADKAAADKAAADKAAADKAAADKAAADKAAADKAAADKAIEDKKQVNKWTECSKDSWLLDGNTVCRQHFGDNATYISDIDCGKDGSEWYTSKYECLVDKAAVDIKPVHKWTECSKNTWGSKGEDVCRQQFGENATYISNIDCGKNGGEWYTSKYECLVPNY